MNNSKLLLSRLRDLAAVSSRSSSNVFGNVFGGNKVAQASQSHSKLLANQQFLFDLQSKYSTSYSLTTRLIEWFISKQFHFLSSPPSQAGAYRGLREILVSITGIRGEIWLTDCDWCVTFSEEYMPTLTKKYPDGKLTGSWRSEIGTLDTYGKRHFHSGTRLVQKYFNHRVNTHFIFVMSVKLA